MTRASAQIFIDHLRSTVGTYFVHMLFSSWLAARFLMAVDEILSRTATPFLYEKTTCGFILQTRAHLTSPY